MQCPRCDSENTNDKTYCTQCGTLLRGFVPYSSEMEYNSPPYSEYSSQSQAFSYHQKLSSRPSVTVLRVIRGILYFIAAPIVALGFIMICNGLFGTSNRAEGLAIFFGLGLLVASVVIFLRMRYRVSRLRWPQFIWSIVGATVGIFMALILVYALSPNGEFSDLSLGSIILLYGFVLAAISLW